MNKYMMIILLIIAALFTGCKSNNKVLYVFNWSDYISDELIKQFEAENNCRIIYSTYDSNESMLTKIINSNESYDLAFPSGDHVTILRNRDLIEPINKKLLTNYKYLDQALLKKADSFDKGNVYSIPYFWGLTGLMYNKQFVSNQVIADSSWNLIANPLFNGKNKVTMLDDAREVVGAALKYAGYDINDTSDEAIGKIRNILHSWDKNITQFDSDSYKNEVADGTTWLAQAYNGDALQRMAENDELGFILPKEGTSLWMDNIVVLKSSTNKKLAYKFIDFLLEPEHAKINAEYVQYATPVNAAYQKLDDKIKNNKLIYPDKSYLDKCSMINYIGENITKIDRIYEELKNVISK